MNQNSATMANIGTNKNNFMKKETKVVVKKEDKKKAVWIGSQTLMGAVAVGSKEDKERELIKMTARVLDISPFGVNILGNLPYINELGLKQKNESYGHGKNEFKYNWVKRAMDDSEKAICECKIVCGDKDVTDWIVGECSPSTIKMGTLKGYQNHMAQTRARNRAIKEAYGVNIHEDMMVNIHNLYSKKEINETQKTALEYHAGKATSVSVEEVEIEKGTKTAPIDNNLFVTPKSSLPPEDKEIFLCQDCDGIITEAGKQFSERIYGRILCKECSKNHNPLKK